MSKPTPRPDNDSRKGATDPDRPEGRTSGHPNRPDQHGNLADQLPHRHSDNSGSDSDFPEPGSNPEHSGQKS